MLSNVLINESADSGLITTGRFFKKPIAGSFNLPIFATNSLASAVECIVPLKRISTSLSPARYRTTERGQGGNKPGLAMVNFAIDSAYGFIPSGGSPMITNHASGGTCFKDEATDFARLGLRPALTSRAC